LVGHDLNVVGMMCEHTIVLQRGRIVEAAARSVRGPAYCLQGRPGRPVDIKIGFRYIFVPRGQNLG
jgi:hypothetical protein